MHKCPLGRRISRRIGPFDRANNNPSSVATTRLARSFRWGQGWRNFRFKSGGCSHTPNHIFSNAIYKSYSLTHTYSRLRNYYNHKYGPSTNTMRLNPRRTTDTWNHLDSKIEIEVNRETGKLKLSVYYTPLSSNVNEQRLETYQGNTRRFLDRIDKDRAVEHFNLIN